MATYDLIALADRAAWEVALEGVSHGFHSTWDFARATQLTTGHPAYLFHWTDGQSQVACSLVERPAGDGHLDLATPSGLAGFAGTARWSDVEPYWNELVRARGYVSAYIGLHPLFAPAGLGTARRPPTSIYALDLRAGRAELLARMDKSRRRELRGWEDRRRDFVVDRDAVGEFLVRTHEPYMRSAGARGPHLVSESLLSLCRSERCIAVGAAPGGEIEAAYLFSYTSHAGDWLLSVAVPEGRRHNTDLLWFGVNELVARDVPVLNLGGGVRENDPIARAKQRLRPARLSLKSLREVYRPQVYAELCRLAAVAPSSLDGYFPAYRAPAPTESVH